jgi:hypothetical protein
MGGATAIIIVEIISQKKFKLHFAISCGGGSTLHRVKLNRH